MKSPVAILLVLVLGTAWFPARATEPAAASTEAATLTRPDPCTPPKREDKKSLEKKPAATKAKTGASATPR
jgi:hypothetical protein